MGKHVSQEEFVQRVREDGDKAASLKATALAAADRQKQEHLAHEQELQRWVEDGGI